jgi:hypothetical protein
MAHLIVMAVDNSPFEKGDVVSCHPEGVENLGVAVLADPMFRIIHAPDMSVAAATALTVAEVGDLYLCPTIKHRGFYIDFKKLPASLQSAIDAGNDITAAAAEIKAAMTMKPQATR